MSSVRGAEQKATNRTGVHRPRAQRWIMATAAASLLIACINVAFLLLAAFFCVSHPALPRDSATSMNGWSVLLLPERQGKGDGGGCDGAHRRLEADKDMCGYAAAASASSFDSRCYPRGRGYVDYLYLFYCVFGDEHRALGYAAMAAWLAVLFYVLADTAAVYFCSSLEGLSRLLRLSPAVAGVTLLSLGNGAPDALSTVASFASGGSGGKGASTVVGLNGLLGGALFVSSAVLGVVCLRVGGRGVAIDRGSFFRDACFLLVALAAVAVVLAAGEISIWGALAFTSLYVVYVLVVVFIHGRSHDGEAEAAWVDNTHASSELCNVVETDFYLDQEPLLPETAPLLQYHAGDATKMKRGVFWSAVRVLELPLYLPRRLTIPDASVERWSKPAAVTAATLSPPFLSYLWSNATGNPLLVLLLGSIAGLSLGLLAFLSTEADAPPTKFLSAWLAGGFVMSVAWEYVVANELLSLLVSAGLVLGVDPATLGLTVLAWGNSLGDLIANVAVAVTARGGGAQVAVAGCYGGPVFNVLVGLGLSLLLSCWVGYPKPVPIPWEPRLYQTLGWVAAGVLWAFVMLPRRGMKVDRTLGFGLLVVYLCFLCTTPSFFV